MSLTGLERYEWACLSYFDKYAKNSFSSDDITIDATTDDDNDKFITKLQINII